MKICYESIFETLEKEELEKRCLMEKIRQEEKEELEKRCLMEKIRQEEKEKFQLLRRETSFMYLKSKCAICYTHARNIVSLPCSHLSLCEHCSNKVDKCPLCQETISCTIKTFRC